jgi:hypothetical protein
VATAKSASSPGVDQKPNPNHRDHRVSQREAEMLLSVHSVASVVKLLEESVPPAFQAAAKRFLG